MSATPAPSAAPAASTAPAASAASAASVPPLRSRARTVLRRRTRRGVLGALATAAVLAALMVVRVLVGTPFVYADQALAVLLGVELPGISFIVWESRLPAAVVAVLAGTAFGLSGTVFQTMLRNPLASPDVIGVTLGASAGAVIAMAFFPGQGAALFWFALLGGLGTAALILLVSGAGRPGAAGAVDNRFVLVGIGIAAAFHAVISYLMTRLPSQTAGDVMHWLVGSLSTSTWERALVLALALAVLLPALVLLVSRLRILQLGDDAATSLGLQVPRTRIALIMVAVTLCALTVAVTGPLAFVAFLAGPLARMIMGRPSFSVAAAVGAVLVLAADVLGQNAFGSVELPAGVITGALGAPFLLWLLTRTTSSGTGR